jgi:diguanylate cyclase (GGDEF)-like protein
LTDKKSKKSRRKSTRKESSGDESQVPAAAGESFPVEPEGGGPAALPPDALAELGMLRAENAALRNELEQVLANASENEKIWRHFAALERLLFRTRELDRLVEDLLKEMRSRFGNGLLVLYLSHPEIQERLFQGDDKSFSVGEKTWVSPLDGETVRAFFGTPLKPVLFSDGEGGPPPGLAEQGAEVRSAALIPLSIGEIVFGALLLCSPDPDRYRPGDGTDLLERLGTNVALSMDNCLTYEKVKDLAVQDQLTGLFNFFQIHSILEREFRQARRARRPLSILVVDFNFVQDDEEFGSGKEVLKHAAGLLEQILPKEGCFLGRDGSSEFLAVLPNVPAEEAREVIPYLWSTIRKSPFKSGNTAILITTLAGVGSLDGRTTCAQDLVDAAYAELCMANPAGA